MGKWITSSETLMPDETPNTETAPEWQGKRKWKPAVDIPAVIPLNEIRSQAKQLRNEGQTGGKLNPLIFIERYAGLWEKLALGAERTLIGKRAKKDRFNKNLHDGEGGYEAVYETNEREHLAYLVECRNLLDSLVKFRREIEGEELGIPQWVINEMVEGLKEYPEAKKALLKRLEQGDK